MKKLKTSNNKAKAYILIFLLDTILAQVKNIEEAVYISKELEHFYAQKNSIILFRASKALTTTSLQKCSSISNHINKLEN